MHAWTRGEKVLCDFEKISQTELAYRKKVFVSRVCVAQCKPFSEQIVYFTLYAIYKGQDAKNFETYLKIKEIKEDY